MRFLSRVVALALALSAAGCASGWDSRSDTHATVYATTSEIPIVMGSSTYVGAIDGVASERGKGYVLVEPGPHTLTIFQVNCPLPILIVTCLRSSTRTEAATVLQAGAVYRVDGSPPSAIQVEHARLRK
jgi:hypothetical protein